LEVGKFGLKKLLNDKLDPEIEDPQPIKSICQLIRINLNH